MSKRKFIYDIDTRNISFLQTASDLKKVGVKNNMFFLKLFDPSLRGVDVYSPSLTNEQMMRIINECIINPWFYLREVARIPDQGNPAGIPYLLNRGNLASSWCFFNNIDHDIAVPRQIGKTQSTLCELTWTYLFGATNSEMMFLNLDQDRANANLRSLKDQRDLLPRFLQFKVAFDEEGNEIKGQDNVKTLRNASNGNSIVTKGKASSVETAERVGRGATQPIQYYDEFEFIPFIKTIIEAAGPAYKTASENAQRNKSAYCRIFSSTAGDLDTRSGEESYEIISNMCKWTEKFYDMKVDDVKDYISTNSGNDIVYIEYQYQQLGKDEIWFNKVCKLVNNNPMKIKREIYLKRLRGSSDSPFEPEDLEAIDKLRGTVIEEIFINKIFKLDVYTKLEKHKIYFIGVDVANGYGEDNSAVTIWDPYKQQTVAEFKSAHIGVKDLIKFLYILVKKYLPRSILAIERNANGEAVLEHLRDTDVRPNIYFDNSKDFVTPDEKLDTKGMLERTAQRRKLYGIYTQGNSRKLMMDLLGEFVKNNKEGFVGNYIIDDIFNLVILRSKIQARAGQHDDNVMSFLMCLYLYYYGNNLSRYGFYRGSLPDEEEQNKGMDYGEVLAALNDTEREFFQGVPFDTMVEDINISQMIEENRGLVSTSELQEIVSPGKNKAMKKFISNDPYTRKIQKEMMEAERESEAFNRKMNFNTSYENLDEDYMEEMNDYSYLSMFDDLND